MLGMLLSALSGGGNATANVGANYQKTADDQAAQQRMFDQQAAMERLRADMNVQQASRIAENQRDAAAEPLQNFSALIKKYSGEEVPVTAAPVTSLSGAGATGNMPTSGFRGDPEAVRATLMQALKDGKDPADVALGLKQLNDQLAADQDLANKAVAGQTRARTPDEAMAAAKADALVNDPVAYMAGKQLGQDKFMTIADGGSVIDTTTGKVIFQNNNKNERALMAAETKLSIAEANNASREEIAKLRLDVANANGSNTPAIVATSKYLFDEGIAKTKPEAWAMAKERASAADSDNTVKIAALLASQPGYKPTRDVGAAGLFADAAALARGLDNDSPAGATPVPSAGAPTPGAIDYLKKNPQLQGQFDAKYGVGTAKRYLGD